MRGIILAGGRGCRLGELTRATNKHLLPVGPWPMVYYPLRKLVGAGATDVLIVTGPEYVGDFARLLGSGSAHNCNLTYRVQDEPGGIAQALGLAEGFCAGGECVAILGDQIFEDPLVATVDAADARGGVAYAVLKLVSNPQDYGVAEMRNGRVVSIEEKPEKPRGHYAIIGLYNYPPDVFDVIHALKPSKRGELEITDVNVHYLNSGRLNYFVMDGYWIDAGTPSTYIEANRLVRRNPPRF